jgi:hypothetical protein
MKEIIDHLEEEREMEWKSTWNDPLTRYLAPYHELIGDKGEL